MESTTERKPTKQQAGEALARILEGDQRVVAYRPEFVDLTGSVMSAILLQQIVYRSSKKHWGGKCGRPFYKFNAPCSHPDYREGDSWQEELKFTRSELETALKRIAVKITKGKSKQEVRQHALVMYWTDKTRKTWYEPNWPILGEKLYYLYERQGDEAE